MNIAELFLFDIIYEPISQSSIKIYKDSQRCMSRRKINGIVKRKTKAK